MVPSNYINGNIFSYIFRKKQQNSKKLNYIKSSKENNIRILDISHFIFTFILLINQEKQVFLKYRYDVILEEND